MECRRKTHAKTKQVWTIGFMIIAVSTCVCVCVFTYIRGVSRFVDVIARVDFLGLCDQKCLLQNASYSERLRSYGCCVIVVNALLWTARRKSHYTTFNRLGQERTLDAATRNSRALHNRAAGWIAASGDIIANLLKAQVCVNWRQFHEIKLSLDFKFIRYYSCLSASVV